MFSSMFHSIRFYSTLMFSSMLIRASALPCIACTFAPLPPYSLVFSFVSHLRGYGFGAEREEREVLAPQLWACTFAACCLDRYTIWTAVLVATHNGPQFCCGQAPPIDGPLGQRGTYAKQTPSSPSSPVAAVPRWEKRWIDSHSLHLLLARISSYIPSTDQLRPNAFEVVAMDGVSSGVLQCCSMHECGEWLGAVSQVIAELVIQHVRMSNKNLSLCEQIVHMGWVEERLPDPDVGQCYQPRFLALKGSNVYIFHSPPISLCDWSRGERTYDLCETFLKVHKDTELRDLRPYCFGILTGAGDTHYLSVELPSDTCVLERAYQKAQFAEVQRVVSKMYSCIWHGHGSLLSIDFNLGFTCLDASTKKVLWRFKFCQLKGSSDDSKTKIKFLFQKSDARLIEAKELEFPNLVAVLHCIHTFISAKVAMVDPMFVENQSATKTSTFEK
uniref:gamma-2-syntrophin-like n=1 Tax=Myxine glutinosa TaxID=7769 RepID=UPI00358E5838